MTGRPFRELHVSAADGLRLYARDYGTQTSGSPPVICLPGLARTSADFHELAVHLSVDEKKPRRVLALDYRGRGDSEWDRDWRNYDIRVEADDVLQVLAAAGVHEAVFIGTSRGGLITMALAAMRPTLLRGAILNDVGPVIDGKGLVRIRGYVGKLPTPRDMVEAGELLRQLSNAQFPHLTAAEWQALARGTWRQREDGRLVLAYDPKLMNMLESIDLETPLPELWHLFEGLKPVPVLAIRGANSDLLSAETLTMMEQRHPDLEAVTVPDQGHTPLLHGNAVLPHIRRFLSHVDSTQR